MPRVDRCNCSCLSPGVTYIPIDGTFFARGYRFAPLCFGGVFPPDDTQYIKFRNNGLGSVWSTENVYEPPDLVTPVVFTIECGETTRTIIGTLTINGRDRGEVEIEIRDADTDVTIAKWISNGAWQPFCAVRLKLTELDQTCACSLNWDPEPCLEPHLDVLGCACNGDLWAYIVSFHIAPWITFDELLAVYEDFFSVSCPDEATIRHVTECAFAEIESRRTLLNSVNFVCEGGLIPGGGGICTWQACVRLNDGPGPVICSYSGGPCDPAAGDVLAANTAWAQVFVVGGALVVNGGANSGGSCFTGVGLGGGTFPLSDPHAGPDVPGHMPQYCLEGGWSNESVTVTPIRIPTTRSGYVDPQCLIPTYQFCGGASAWELVKQPTTGGKSRWVWVLLSSDCDGWCNALVLDSIGFCHSTIPDEPVLPEGDITDEEAEGYGLTGLDGETFVGGCGCGPRYYTPCVGGSMWTLTRATCFDIEGTTYYLYSWSLDSSNCDGECSDCNPVPPYDLETDPITQATATGLGYDDDLGMSIAGGCDCVAAYVQPECPECTCEEAALQKTFTITAPGFGYDGTYVILKGECETPDCCWRGFEEDTQVAAELSWAAPGTWTCVFDGGVTYTTSGGVCDDPIVLSVVGSPADWPSTITVSDV